MFEDDKELIVEFVVESRDGLAGIETDLLSLETDGDVVDLELVNRVFRTVHTIKGTSGFLDLHVIGKLAHGMENVLSLMRNSELAPSEDVIDELLKAADTLSSLIENVETSNAVDVSDHIAVLTNIANGGATATIGAAVDSSPSAEQRQNKYHNEFELGQEQLAMVDSQGRRVCVLTFDIGDGLKNHAGSIKALIQCLHDTGNVLHSYADCEHLNELLVNSPTDILLHVWLDTVLEPNELASFFNLEDTAIRCVTAAEPRAETAGDSPAGPDEPAVETAATVHAPTTDSATSSTEKAGHALSIDASVRVPVNVLDSLMNLAGELVLGRNQMLQSIKQQDMRNQ